MKGTRALAAEADLAWTFLSTLTPEQRRAAVVSETAPADIVTLNARKAASQGNTGLEFSALSDNQRTVLQALIQEHASAQSPELAEARMAKVRADKPTVRFAWMGSTTKAPGVGHYYRIQGATFLIEYDNTQNSANHQHIVWRDFNGDFGGDLLAAHYSATPHVK